MKYNSRTITLTTDAVQRIDDLKTSNSTNDAEATQSKAEALAILLGKYNKYGRHIDLEKVEEIIRRFNNLVSEMEQLNNESKQNSEHKQP